MALNPGDRVKWAHWDETTAKAIEADEVHGVIDEIIISYRVTWDNGEQEIVEAEDLVREES